MKIWKRDYYEKLFGIPLAYDDLKAENEKLKEALEFIIRVDSYPDLSYDKYRVAMDLMVEKARKALGKR